MSRCFPFPPPGFEKKTTTNNVELVTKENHKDKRNKKDKKEKREGKERKHKEKNREKNGERNRKEKDRKKKDKDKDKKKNKDKDGISNLNILDRQSRHHHGESSQTTGPSKDFKLTKLLDTRIRNDGIGNEMVGNSIYKSLAKHVGTRKVAEKGYGFDTKTDENDNVHEKRTDPMGNTLVDGKTFGNNIVNNFISKDQRIHVDTSRKHVDTSRKVEMETATDTKVNRKFTVNEVRTGTMGNMLGEGTVNNKMAHNFTTIEQRKLSNACTNGKVDNEISSCMANMHVVGSIGRKIVNNSITMEQGQQVGTSGIAVIEMDLVANEKRVGAMLEGCIVKNKVDRLLSGNRGMLEKDPNQGIVEREERVANVQKREKKDKERGRKKEKKKEIDKKREKTKHKKDKEKCDDFNVNLKRKHINGILHEGDLEPNKLPKTALISHLPVENGRKSDIPPVATSCLSDCLGDTADIVISERMPDNKEHKANGVIKPQQAEVVLETVSTDDKKVGEVFRKPHPDEKFLNRILCVPKMEEYLEIDEQEWLLGGEDIRPKANTKTTTDITPTVWSKALRIDEADVLALPYVIPY